MERRSNIALAACLIATLSSGVALADTSLTVETGVGHSDNITRVEEGAIDETLATAGVDLVWELVRPRFTADATVNADYFHYLDDTYESEVVGAGNAALNFFILPERFNWIAQDFYGQASNDPFAPVTPDNREDINFFTTGPEFAFQFGGAGVVRLYGHYSLATYETSPLDSQRSSVGASVGRSAARGGGLSLNVAAQSIEFDDQPLSDYDQRSAFLAYRLVGARTQIRAEGGYTSLEPTIGEKSSAPRVLLEVTRQLSPGSSLALNLGSQLTDSSSALGSSFEGPVGATSGITASADPYENRNAALTWLFVRRRTSLSLGVTWNSEEYETQSTLDRKRTGFIASISRDFGARLTGSLDGTFLDETFDASDFTAKSKDFGASLNWQLGRSVGLRLSAERSNRSTSTGLGEYTENRAYLRVYYIALRGTPDGGAAP